MCNVLSQTVILKVFKKKGYSRQSCRLSTIADIGSWFSISNICEFEAKNVKALTLVSVIFAEPMNTQNRKIDPIVLSFFLKKCVVFVKCIRFRANFPPYPLIKLTPETHTKRPVTQHGCLPVPSLLGGGDKGIEIL